MKKVLILGAGKSGKAAAKLLQKEAEVTLWDDSFTEGEKPAVADYDVLLLSPGIPQKHPMVQEAKRLGLEITGELETAFEHCAGTFVAITGTNGKTTTTALVGEIFRLAGRDTRVVGNIGLAACEEAAAAGKDTWMITEVSSFQLETASRFAPKISAILNITPDHLDRHGSFEEYARVKALVFANQGPDDCFVYNMDDPETRVAAQRCERARKVPFSRVCTLTQGAFVLDGWLCFAKESGEPELICRTDELKIPGLHNLENALAALAICRCAGIPAEAIAEGMKTFPGVEHRIEFVRELDGVRYVNDSKGTNPDASMKALEATKTPILLIAGGYEKNSDFTEFIRGFGGKVRHLLLLGQTAQRFAETARACGFPEEGIHFCRDMAECVELGRALAQPGDTVLLSPASASWGMFQNYEQRGEIFKQLVNELE